MKDFHVRRGVQWIVMSLFLTVAGCGGDSPTDGGNGGGGGGGGGGSDPVATTSVTVGDDFFDPASIQVSPGAMVMWTWSSSRVHNVTFTSSLITNSGDQGGGTYSTAMPTAAAVYNYQCTIHSGMNGSVTVQ